MSDKNKENIQCEISTLPLSVEFCKVKCTWCGEIYFECAECLLLMQRVGPHNCLNQHVGGLLTGWLPEQVTRDECGVLCISFHNRSMCDHVFEDIVVQV
jgi:hypothetical protein